MEDTTPAAEAAASGANVLLREVINYFSFLFRVPVLVCFVAMIGVVAIILQDVYPGAAAAILPLLLGWLPTNIHLETAGFVKLYGALSTVLYALSLLVRLALRGRTFTVRYRTQFAVAAACATLGWGFVLYNVRFLRVAAGTSRTELALLFLFFYLLTLVAFAAALALSRFADFVAAALSNAVDRRFGAGR